MRLLKLILAVGFVGFAAPAFAETCFSSGEAISGMNKICHYRCTSGAASKTIQATGICPLSVTKGATRGQAGLGSSNPNSDFSGNQTCFKTGEYLDGMNKVCRYNCNGSPAETTIRSTQLCPLSVNR